jgi:hypothetical protein
LGGTSVTENPDPFTLEAAVPVKQLFPFLLEVYVVVSAFSKKPMLHHASGFEDYYLENSSV